MLMTERVREVVRLNLTSHYIPLILWLGETRVFPVYFAEIMDEDVIAIPVTGATGIDEALSERTPASAVVADRAGGYEAYVLEGIARHVSDAADYELVAAMRNAAPGFPIHGAVIFEVETAHLVPPP